MYNLPNILTISRIAVIPVIFLSIYIPGTFWSVLTIVLYVVAAITDYLDGYLARSRNQTSAFGRLLDPIADKLLVISVLLVIVANRMVLPVSYIPVIVILCREILVSGLREFLAEVKVGLPVTRLAKWKTGFQMTALGLLLAGAVPFFRVSGEICLWVAGVLTFVTGYQYFAKSLEYVKKMEKEEQKPAKPAKVETAEVSKPVKAKAKTAKKVVAKKATVKKTVAKKPAVKKAKVEIVK